MGRPISFLFPLQGGTKAGVLLRLKDIQAGLRSLDSGGMLQTLLLTLPAPLFPGPLTAPQSCCREATLEEGGTSTEAGTISGKGPSSLQKGCVSGA